MTSAVPTPGLGIPSPKEVTGKDYSDHGDKDDLGAPSPEQNLAWDGLGGTRNAQNYLGSRAAFPDVDQALQVDGLAAGGDALFHALQGDQAALLFSVGELGYTGGPGDGRVFAEPVAAGGGAGAAFVWATVPQVDSLGVTDLDGLEVWGGDNVDDSDRYSLYRDPFVLFPAASRKVAIWSFFAGASSPHTFTSDLAAAMDMQYGGPGFGPLFGQLVELMDVDAIMVLGDEVIFSIAPLHLSQIDPLLPDFDGGEIFTYVPGSPTAFLRHGGHDWDTLFDVRGTFGVLSENIDAIEAAAVPEPATVVLGALAALGLGLVARRRRAAV
jgi:hypothetical protein